MDNVTHEVMKQEAKLKQIREKRKLKEIERKQEEKRIERETEIDRLKLLFGIPNTLTEKELVFLLNYRRAAVIEDYVSWLKTYINNGGSFTGTIRDSEPILNLWGVCEATEPFEIPKSYYPKTHKFANHNKIDSYHRQPYSNNRIIVNDISLVANLDEITHMVFCKSTGKVFCQPDSSFNPSYWPGLKNIWKIKPKGLLSVSGSGGGELSHTEPEKKGILSIFKSIFKGVNKSD